MGGSKGAVRGREGGRLVGSGTDACRIGRLPDIRLPSLPMRSCETIIEVSTPIV